MCFHLSCFFYRKGALLLSVVGCSYLLNSDLFFTAKVRFCCWLLVVRVYWTEIFILPQRRKDIYFVLIAKVRFCCWFLVIRVYWTVIFFTVKAQRYLFCFDRKEAKSQRFISLLHLYSSEIYSVIKFRLCIVPLFVNIFIRKE